MTKKQIEKFYEREVLKVNKKLQSTFNNCEPKSLYVPCAYALETGGKRLRPFLVMLSAKAVGGKISEVYNAALAVEILHNFTLIHDDIMDNADIRRGRAAYAWGQSACLRATPRLQYLPNKPASRQASQYRPVTPRMPAALPRVRKRDLTQKTGSIR